jgi:hypothetical protein
VFVVEPVRADAYGTKDSSDFHFLTLVTYRTTSRRVRSAGLSRLVCIFVVLAEWFVALCVLIPLGIEYAGEHYICRPGKAFGTSATLGNPRHERKYPKLHVFSTATAFDIDKTYLAGPTRSRELSQLLQVLAGHSARSQPGGRGTGSPCPPASGRAGRERKRKVASPGRWNVRGIFTLHR